MSVYFVSGIDTDAGKSVATGIVARTLKKKGKRVITQKFIQTGCQGISEDILTHRKIMEMEIQEVDRSGLTCPYVMSYPASPHLAAEIDGIEIEPDVIRAATDRLEKEYDIVLLEGAGGLYVPVTPYIMTIDYIQKHNYPLILVTSARLGSINHTLMSLELCRMRGIPVRYVIYNHFPEAGQLLRNDTWNVIERYLNEFFPACELCELPLIKGEEYPELLPDLL